MAGWACDTRRPCSSSWRNIISNSDRYSRLCSKSNIRPHYYWYDVKHLFMSSEDRTSLLQISTVRHDQLDDVYLRFSSSRKNIILAMVSVCGVINCMFVCSDPPFQISWMTRLSDWILYTFDTTNCQGPEFNRGSCQVIHLNTLSSRRIYYFLFSV
jgi:hypothetical protein